MAIWWQEAMCMCSANVCGLCSQHISTGSCLYNQISASRHMSQTWAIFILFQAPHFFPQRKFRSLSFVTSLNTGNHEAITRPFLFHSKVSTNFDFGSLRVSASRNFKQRKDIEWTSNGTGPELDNYWWLTIDMEWSCNYHSRMCLSYVTWCHNMGPET